MPNTKNYREQGGDKWVIGGTLEVKDTATVTGLPEGGGEYTLPAATASVIGGVKAASNVTALEANAELSDVITGVNAILTALKAAGSMVADA